MNDELKKKLTLSAQIEDELIECIKKIYKERHDITPEIIDNAILGLCFNCLMAASLKEDKFKGNIEKVVGYLIRRRKLYLKSCTKNDKNSTHSENMHKKSENLGI